MTASVRVSTILEVADDWDAEVTEMFDCINGYDPSALTADGAQYGWDTTSSGCDKLELTGDGEYRSFFNQFRVHMEYDGRLTVEIARTWWHAASPAEYIYANKRGAVVLHCHLGVASGCFGPWIEHADFTALPTEYNDGSNGWNLWLDTRFEPDSGIDSALELATWPNESFFGTTCSEDP